MVVKSGEVPVGYNTSSQSQTFHKPTFMCSLHQMRT